MRLTPAHLLFVLAALASILLASRPPAFMAMAVAGGNLLAFALFGYDKLAAQDGRVRVPEAALHACAFLGVAGASAGRLFLRHKTLHLSFGVVQLMASGATLFAALHLG